MDTDYQIFMGVFVFLVLLWIFLETHYFIQIVFTIIRSRFFRKRVGVLEETSYYGICSTTDIDIFLDHMNNSRYLRDVDFARSDFYLRTRLYGKVLEKGGKVMVGANVVIYRRPIRPFAGYNIMSKIVYWDKKSIFMDHRFVTTRDAVVRASILSQQRFIDCEADVILQELQGPEVPIEKPTMPAEVARLLESIKTNWASSQYEHRVTSDVDADVLNQNKLASLPANGNLNANGQDPLHMIRTENSSNGDYIQKC